MLQKLCKEATQAAGNEIKSKTITMTLLRAQLLFTSRSN